MLKTIRESAIERPWFYRTLMVLIATAFVVTMGWWGFQDNKEDIIISVGSTRVSRDEYQRAYQNTYRFFKEKMQGDLPEDQLKEQVISQLIGYYLWLQAATDMGVMVTADELRESIMNNQVFQTQGKFDPEKYKRLLAQNKLTPERYELSYRADLMIQKAQMLVRESVVPTTDELAMAQALVASQLMPKLPMTEQAVPPLERAQQAILAEKQERAVRGYQEALKAKVKVSVRRELM